MRGMMNEILQILGRENRCVGVILLVFGVIQVLLLSALLLPEDPVIYEIQPYPSSTGKVHVAFKSRDAATQEVKNANATVPTDRIGENPAANISENEDRIAAEPADNSTTRGDGMGHPGTVIISPDSLEVVLKLYDQPAASGIGIKPPEMTTTIDIKEDYEFIPVPGSTRAAMETQPPIAIREFVVVSTSSSAKHSTSPIPLKPALMSVVYENRIPEEMKKRTCRKGSEARETQRWVLTDHSKQTPKLPVNAISDENIKSQYSTSSKKLMSEGLHSKLLTVPNNDFEILHIEENIRTKDNAKRWDSPVKDIEEISFLNTDVLEESSRVEIDNKKNKTAYKAEAKGLLQRKKKSLEELSINLPVQVNPKVNMQKPFSIIQNKELSITIKTPEQVVEELNDGECEIIFECIRGKNTERTTTLVEDVKESLTQSLTPEIKDVEYELTENMRTDQKLASIFPTIFGNSSEKVRVEFKEDFQTYTAIELQKAEFSEVSNTSYSVKNYINEPLQMNPKKRVRFPKSQNDIYIYETGSLIKENEKKDSLKDNPGKKLKKSVVYKSILKNTYAPTKEIMKKNVNQGNISVTFEKNDYQETQPVEEECCVILGEGDYPVTNWMEQPYVVRESDYHETCSVVAESCVSKEEGDYLVPDNMRKFSFVDNSDDYRTQLVAKESSISKESNYLVTDFVPESDYLQTQPVLIVNENECEESLIKVLELTPKMNDLKFKEDIEIVCQKSPALMKKPITKTDLCSRISSEDDNHTVLEDTCSKVKSKGECHFQGQPYLKEIVQNISLNNHQYFLEETVTTREMKESSVSNEEPDLTIKALMRKYECKENIEHPCKTFSLEGEMRNAEILKQNKIWEKNNNDKKKDHLNYKKRNIEEQSKIIFKNQGVSEPKLKSMNKSLMFLYNQLTEFRNAQIFKKPVTEEEAPDYKSIILRPMDFSTIKKNIQSGAISNITELENDVILMIDNAMLYNPCTHIVHKMAKEMRSEVLEFFEKCTSTTTVTRQTQSRQCRFLFEKQRFTSEVEREKHVTNKSITQSANRSKTKSQKHRKYTRICEKDERSLLLD